MKNQYGRNVFITGASSGIGKACAVAFAKKGFNVTGVSRNCKEGEKEFHGGGILRMKKMDVTDEEAVSRVISEVGEIDIAILSAGVGIAGAIEDTPVSYARRQMEINYFGVLNVCSKILPGMHANGKGLIIVIGSVAGRVSIPMQSQYSASKYALEAYVDALRLETEPYGIRAVLIEPGDTKTGFTDNRDTYIKEDSIYSEITKRAVGRMEKDERNGARPEAVAKVALSLVEKSSPPARVAVGLQYKLAMMLIKHLPDSAREKIIRRMYLS